MPLNYGQFIRNKNTSGQIQPPGITKLKLFDSIIQPILLYRSKVWGLTLTRNYIEWDKTRTAGSADTPCTE